MENAQVVSDVVERVDTTVSPLLNRVEGGIESVREALLSLRERLEALNELPLINIDIPGVEQLDELAATVQGLQDQVAEVRTKIENLSQPPGHARDAHHRFPELGDLDPDLSACSIPDSRLAAYRRNWLTGRSRCPNYDWTAAIRPCCWLLAFSQAALSGGLVVYKGVDLLAAGDNV
jgi:hypothetical protein